MASSEKELIPLNDLPPKHENIPEKPSTAGTTDLVPSKFPSRPRRKVVVVVTVIAVVVLVIIAASLIGKYIPEYLRDAENKSRKDTTDKGAEEPKGPTSSKNQVSPTATSETKSLPQTTSSVIQHTPISPIPEFTTFAAVTLSSRSDISASSARSGVADSSVIANLLPNIATNETKSLPQTTSSVIQHTPISPTPEFTTFAAVTLSSRSDISASSASSGVADLSVIANLLPNTESKWSRWSPWSDCTKTCGTGTRYRNRACIAINDRAVFAPISCAGKSDQIKLCAEWKCPDCSRNCTIGTLNAACDACTCIHHELSGRVLTEDNIPLSDANISLAETPYNIIAQTNISGYFATLGVCAIQQELLITKAGFVPVKLMANVTTPTTVNISAKMEIAVAPFVTVHPESKMRMPGQSVTFCCEGEGNPPPEIEWFKENNVIDKSLYNYNNTLEINDVQGLNGTFRCRAINQFGSEFSSVAELIVLENSEDSCPSMPSLNDLTLPPGCLVNGTNSTIVNVGECEPIACVKRGVNFSSSCSDPPLCCGPLLFESVSVKCAAMSFDLSVVKRCGCGKCIEKQTIISGVAVGQNGYPAILVDLFFRGKSVGNTNAEGKFSFSVPETTKRAIVTFKDQKRKKFVEEDKIFVVEKGQTAIYTVKLREKPAPVTFNASEPLDVALGSDSSDSFADLELPENALLTEDGSVFSGIAKATVSVTDPRNQSDIESAPGDFSSMNEDGEEELLQTFGMIKLNLEDDSGKPLTMSKPMKVYLDSEKLNSSVSDGNVSPKLYWLDKKTGRWREAGEFMLEDGKNRRRKRSDVKRTFLAATVTPSLVKRDLNFDTPRERVALRVTIAGNSDISDASNDRVLVRVICPHPNGYFMEKVTTPHRLACIVILRNADCFVQALKGNDFYEPATTPDDTKRIFTNVNGSIVSSEGTGNTIKSFRFESKLKKNDHDGPTYSVEPAGKKKCEASLNSAEAPDKERAQFEFKSPENTIVVYEHLLMKDPSLWSSKDGKCFIRVVYKGKEVIFMAASYKKDNFDEDTAYGYHLRKSENCSSSGSTQVVCLQFPCPVKKEQNPVFLLVTPVSSTDNAVIKFNKLSPLIKAVQNSNMKLYKNPLEKRFLINYDLIGFITFENLNKCLKSDKKHLEFT